VGLPGNGRGNGGCIPRLDTLAQVKQWRSKIRDPARSVLDATDDRTAPGWWRQASADDLLHKLEPMGSGDARVIDGELRVRQIKAYEASAAESRKTARTLVNLTWAIAGLTLVLVFLTVVLVLTEA
jgi:hypothetical protein